MAAGFHPVPAGGHRTPPGGAGLAVVDQEQAALGVRARAQPPRALLCEGVPAEDGPDSQARPRSASANSSVGTPSMTGVLLRTPSRNPSSDRASAMPAPNHSR